MDLNIKNKQVSSTKEFFGMISNQNDVIYPDFKEDRSEWVKYGTYNDFPNELLKLFNKSGIHNAIIESKCRMMIGDGIVQAVNDEEELSDATQLFIDKPNPYETLDEVYSKLALDYEIHGLAYIEIIWNKQHNKIIEIYHIDATKIRWGKLNDKGRVDTYYYSRDFQEYKRSNYKADRKPIPIPIFNSETKEPRQLLPIIRYSPGQEYYTLPDYFGAVKWIHIDTEIANFHFNNLRNGMVPTIFFGFPVGEKTDDERRDISEALQEKYGGTNKVGGALVAFYDAEGDKKPEVTILEMSNADQQFDLLNKTSLQQILIGHKVVNENLVGISTPGKLGNSNELLSSYKLYFETIVKHEQQKILNSLQRICLINGYTELKVINNEPFEFEFSESTLKEILSLDEMRDLIGYEMEIEDDVTVIGEPEPQKLKEDNGN